MNERIRELWTKAAESTAAYPSGQNNSWETQVNFLDKFAELIVQECAKVCYNPANEIYEARVPMLYEANKRIKEHFGVE